MATTNKNKLRRLTNIINNITGDYAEVGVWKGDTFKQLIGFAKEHGKQAHAYDSFVGMNTPGENDLGKYQKGKYDVGGCEMFNDMLSKHGFSKTDYKTFEGYIPTCFDETSPEQKYSFIYLDVDHYEATKIALPWCWMHLSPGGMLLLDDYFVGKQGLASLAIKEWLDENVGEYKELELDNTQLALLKNK